MKNVFEKHNLFCFEQGFIASVKESRVRFRRASMQYQGEKPLRKPGAGFLFLGYKEYEFGDDLRFLEVHKLYSTKRLIRQFEATSHDSMVIILDNSSSMYAGVAGEALHKIKFAINAACSLALMGIQSGIDSQVGIMSAYNSKQSVHNMVWSKILRREIDYIRLLYPFIQKNIMQLDINHKYDRKSYAKAMWKEIPPRNNSKNLFIISDFWYPWKTELADTLLKLSFRFKSINLIQVLSKDELEFGQKTLKSQSLTLIDSESPGSTIVVHSDLLEHYYKRAQEHCEQLKTFSRQHGIAYYPIKVPLQVDDEKKILLKALAKLTITY